MKIHNYLKLYDLIQRQKIYKDKIIVEIVYEDVNDFHFEYCIPPNVELFMRTNIGALTKSIIFHLIGKPADIYTVYSIVLEILSRELNIENIGVCIKEEHENLIYNKVQAYNNLQVYRS